MIHGEMATKWIQMAGCQRQWYVRIDKKTVTILKQSADEGGGLPRNEFGIKKIVNLVNYKIDCCILLIVNYH